MSLFYWGDSCMWTMRAIRNFASATQSKLKLSELQQHLQLTKIWSMERGPLSYQIYYSNVKYFYADCSFTWIEHLLFLNTCSHYSPALESAISPHCIYTALTSLFPAGLSVFILVCWVLSTNFFFTLVFLVFDSALIWDFCPPPAMICWLGCAWLPGYCQ